MRFYELVLTPPVGTTNQGGLKTLPGGQPKIWTSNPDGYDPSAQDIWFDVTTTAQHLPTGAYVVGIAGVRFDDLLSSNNYKDWQLQLYAGMAGGLPLSANQPTPGLIAQGIVQSNIGNWDGTDMTLSFIVVPTETTGNIVLTWKKGASLAQALNQTLSVAFPNLKIVMAISPKLILGYDEQAYFHTLSGLARAVYDLTVGLLSPTYAGVSIYAKNGTIVCTDFSVPPTAKVLAYDDFIGQPTWVGNQTISIFTALRADVQTGDAIAMPDVLTNAPGMVTTQPNLGNAYFNYKKLFTGTFEVLKTRQVGHFRGDSGKDWMTVIEAVATGSASG